MKRKIVLTLVICLAGIVNLSARKVYTITEGCNIGTPASYNDSSICLQIENNYLRIDFINPSVFRIRMNNKDHFPDGGMVKYGIVNTRCQHHKVKKNSKGSTIELSTDSARIINILKARSPEQFWSVMKTAMEYI
jgi:hypothetical protein